MNEKMKLYTIDDIAGVIRNLKVDRRYAYATINILGL